MLTSLDLSAAQERSVIGRTSPLVKLGLALAWLVGLVTISSVAAPLVQIGRAHV